MSDTKLLLVHTANTFVPVSVIIVFTHFYPFLPIINHFTQIAEDMSETKRLLVHTANTYVPVSVIIVGVGRANKEKMKILDGDNRTLTSNEGVRAKRDIVQFVGE